MVDSPYFVEPGRKVDLSKIPTDDTGKFKDKEDAEKGCKKNIYKLGELQEVLYAQGAYALLVVLQGMDGGGKDGVIEHVFAGVNPQGCQVTSFKAPSSVERAHDYLWRIHHAVPPKGMIGIFNRSHYEDVLIVRVKGLAPKSVWSRRYDHINAFERMLSEEGVTVIKFFLHISKQEQKERFEARLKDKTKHWKFNPADVAERARWDAYQEAYEEALAKCSTAHAPWYVVPSDKKWFRNWVVSDTLVRTMEKMGLKFPPAPEGVEKVKIPD